MKRVPAELHPHRPLARRDSGRQREPRGHAGDGAALGPHQELCRVWRRDRRLAQTLNFFEAFAREDWQAVASWLRLVPQTEIQQRPELLLASAWVAYLSGRTARIADVPDMERAAAYVVPLRIGGGTRLKIYEAMAMEKAIVSTTVGAEGLPVTDGKELFIADTPEQFAAAVVNLLTNPSRANEVGQQARQTVVEKFGWSGVAKCFAEICETTIRDRHRARVATSVDVRSQQQSAV